MRGKFLGANVLKCVWASVGKLLFRLCGVRYIVRFCTVINTPCLYIAEKQSPSWIGQRAQTIYFFNSYFKSPILAAGHLQRSVAIILVAGDCQNHT